MKVDKIDAVLPAELNDPGVSNRIPQDCPKFSESGCPRREPWYFARDLSVHVDRAEDQCIYIKDNAGEQRDNTTPSTYVPAYLPARPSLVPRWNFRS